MHGSVGCIVQKVTTYKGVQFRHPNRGKEKDRKASRLEAIADGHVH